MFKALLATSFVGLLAYPGHARSASFMLGAPVNVPAVPVGGATAVAIADFNGDGRDDLAAVTRGQLEVSLQRPDGSLAPAVRLGIPDVTFRTVRRADLGSDGDIEILVGHDKGLSVYAWNELGAFSRVDHPGAYACWNLAAADIDGDGAPDVVCVGAGADTTLYYSNAATVLAPPVHTQTAGARTGLLGDVVLEDLTGDGKPELLLSSLAANSLFVYRHDGNRGFLPAVAYTYPGEMSGSQAIAVLDIDRDGTKEVVVAAAANRPRAIMHIYRQGGLGYLELSRSLPTFDIPAAFLVSDLDRDGNPDLAVGHAGWSTLGRYMGQAQGLAAVELWSSVAVDWGSRGLAVGDLDHDGYLDMAVANSFGVSVLHGGRPVPSDFNADFTSDIVWRAGSGEVLIWQSANSATAQSLTTKDAGWSSQAIGDFDGDGMADLFWRNLETGDNEILSTGLSSVAFTTGVGDQDWQVAAAGDFDGDGRSDLFWRNGRTGANGIWRSGDSTTTLPTSGVSDLGWKVAGTGDFDGDGRSDVLWRHSSTGKNGIWRSGGSDGPLPMSTVANLQWSVAGIGDFNGDGKDDVVWRNPATGENRIWASANSATAIEVASVASHAYIAAVGDYNSDGRADLLWRNRETGGNAIWRSADARQVQSVSAAPGWTVIAPR